MGISGKAVVDMRTKKLLQRIKPGQIAVIHHRDMDVLAAEGLVKRRVRAVINFEASISGRFINEGPKVLHAAKIPLYDVTASINEISEGDFIKIDEGGKIFVGGNLVSIGKLIDIKTIISSADKSREQYPIELEKFVSNTLEYVKRESSIILDPVKAPKLKTRIAGRHVLVVVRGREYKKDLLAITSYIQEMKPVLIGVDGGADALIEIGHIPDIIVGDMDSISDKGLLSGAEIVVHAYKDGRAPGIGRVKGFGLQYKLFPMTGTSEDAALLLAYEAGADLLVAVGTHTNMIDFLEKGRKGMASTFLARLIVGHILVDAKGVNKLYHSDIKLKYFAAMCFAAGLPISLICITSPVLRHLIRLFTLRLKLMLSLM